MKLVIVESPTKARKLTGFLGSGYKVESSVGHIVDLPKSGINIDFEHDFAPKYEIMPDKKKVVSRLRQLASQADEVYLASDPDREGEAIAWHLQSVLSDDGQQRHFKRATFHEITKEAVQEAIAHPSTVNLDLVNAQQARRVLDRIVGYQVSPILWKKVRRGLSAGRVQSVALRLIVEREKEIIAFVPEEFWELGALVSVTAGQKPIAKSLDSLKERLKKNDLPENVFLASVTRVDGKKYEPKIKDQVDPIVQLLQQGEFSVTKVDKKQRKVSSYPPFTTSTLQQAAATRLGMTSKQTMTLAQQLYENGLITYHRTDSFNLSTKAVAAARGFIQKAYGEEYLPEKPRHFAKKSKNAQEAHEAIRVTDVKVRDITGVSGKLTASHQKLYDLIWRRFVACQMSEARYDQTTVLLEAKHGQKTAELRASGSIKRFDGWTKLFAQSEDKIIPELQVGQPLYFVQEMAEQKFTQPPARYNDASIVKKLEELGIGRPSTYASIISVIIDRGYVERQQKKFFATSVGITVSDFLLKNLHQFMEYDFTADMEEQLDDIARGEKSWTKVLHEFYTPFSQGIKEVEAAERVQIPVEKTGQPCPECGASEGGEIVIRQGKYGKFRSCSRFPDCKYSENIQEKLEGQHCPLCGEGDVVFKPSRWGKKFYGCSRYPDCTWASWSKPAPDLKITPEQWAQMQAEREERKKKRQATLEAKKSAATKAAKAKKTSRTSKKTTTKKKTTRLSAKKPTAKTTKKTTVKKSTVKTAKKTTKKTAEGSL
ncbi:type I DNA topoisomerase [bacterium]|nr:type I DNA topoisomerase [bacterium]